MEIILMEPENSGNVGAVARVMKNFGLESLTLISPKCNHLDLEALSRAKHAKDVLKKAKTKTTAYLKKHDLLIATTAQLGNDYNLPRSYLSPKILATKLPKKGKIALLFGREGIGLKNEEIQLADITVHIPSSKKYPTLNLSQAVAILCYELTQEQNTETHTLATNLEKKIINQKFSKLLNTLSFATPDKKQTQKIVWKRILGKALLTKRESFAILGLLKKLLKLKR
jgi:TrmH family RNA methyltransferase